MTDNSRCTVMVHSCDNYSDLWDAFFKLFHIMWKDCPYDILLCTESKAYTYPELEIRTYSHFKPGKRIPWGKCIRYHLSKIETEYVIVILDDLFLRASPDAEYIERILDFMDSDNSIAAFTFCNVEDSANKDCNIFPEFTERPNYGKYKYNLNVGIWRTRDLLYSIMPFETVWAWELYGNIRSIDDGKRYFSLKNQINENRIIQYVWDGYKGDGKQGIWQGKWVIESVDPLFKKYNIDVDYSLRGIYEHEKDGLRVNNTKCKIIRRWKILRSLKFSLRHIKNYYACSLGGTLSYKEFLWIFLRKFGIYDKVYRQEHSEYIRFIKDKGEKLTYSFKNIGSDSIVFDVGGYHGDYADEMYLRYQPSIYIFEPVSRFADMIAKRFEDNEKIKIFRFGLADEDCFASFSIDNDASSRFKQTRSSTCEVELRDVTGFIRKNNLSNIALMKINIEGGEYDLLNRLIDTELISVIDNILIQFHDFIPGAEEKMKEIQEKLAKTHTLSWQYRFVWEKWERMRNL